MEAEGIGRDDGLFGVEMKSKRKNPCPDGNPTAMTKQIFSCRATTKEISRIVDTCFLVNGQ